MAPATERVNKERYWDRQTARYDRIVRILNRRFNEMMPGLLHSVVMPGAQVLELGAGTGLLTQWMLSAAHVTVTDISEEMLKACQRRLDKVGTSRVTYLRADIYNLPFDERSFDIVVCGNLLHLLDRPPEALAELRRVLRPGGKFIAPTYCHGDGMHAKVVSYAMSALGFPVVSRFSRRSLCLLLEQSGFCLDSAKFIQGLLPVAWLEASASGAETQAV